MSPRYLIVLKDGGNGAFTVDELLPGDFNDVPIGQADIIRLSDMKRYENGRWVRIPKGIAETPDLGEDGVGERQHFHPRYMDPPKKQTQETKRGGKRVTMDRTARRRTR